MNNNFFNNKVIAISGNYSSGKSFTTYMMANCYKNAGANVLIIDFDIFNKSISTLLGSYKNLNNQIIKISTGLSLFTNIDFIFNDNNKISCEKISQMIKKFKMEYDIILIDTSSEINLKFTKAIFMNVDKIIFLIEGNLLEIKKSKILLDVYINDWKIEFYKFNIVINKVNKFSIEKSIIKDIFNKIKIIGEIKFKCEYTNYINNSLKGIININPYRNIISKI